MGPVQVEIIGGENGNAYVRLPVGSPPQLEGLLHYAQQRPAYGGHCVLVADGEALPENWQSPLQERTVDQVIGWRFKEEVSAGRPFVALNSPVAARQYFSKHQFANTLFLVHAGDEPTCTDLLGYMGAPLHQATLQVDLDALHHNLEVHRSVLTPGTSVAVMVKANAYGAGLIETGRALERAGVDYLAVAYADEGLQLRRAGVECPIMVLKTELAAFEHFVQGRLEPVVYHFPLLKALAGLLEEHQVDMPVHLEFNTGMNRLGFEPEEARPVGEFIGRQAHIRVATAFAHLAASGAPQHDRFTEQQMAKFTAACTELDRHLGYRAPRHLLNSGGVARFPQYDMDMVRLGIGVYGADETSVLQTKLRTVMQLQACISQVRTLQAGETVGYSRAGQLPVGSKVATLGIGYADGVPRALSRGRHKVLINGQLAPIAGNVCMDMCMVDVTHIPDVEAGSLATIFGAEPTVEVTAERLGTIPYEVFTNVGPRVRRIYRETV
ncbi:alanine racemase [Phaeodactylibacter sp.]|uniref:alanine racemase n=1 Tax=Phaeodactylibacter sp. TaxID=1940289 RepID=UPI0025CBA80E|nr:alanine racemase [Phaeodactylibacter sp.]MCI4648747.1 alanine racemase [Phaeodactylibacter sp.]MCI5091351.1 alanine racemase [Phaeodactylibacter sp.]